MLKQVVIVAAVLMWANVASPKIEHAPTVEQCQADQRLWLATLENASARVAVKVETLMAWDREMLQCYAVDPSALNSVKYLNTSEEAGELVQTRFINFLARHHLYEQFESEDAAGLR